MTDQPLADAAQAYAWAGVPVIACHWPTQPTHDNGPLACSCGRGQRCDRPAKHPLTRNGLHDATTRPATIRSWWDRWPHANIGLATGTVFDVLDIDGPDGLRTVDSLGLTRTPVSVRTPVVRIGGGWHYLFTPTGTGNRVRIADGLDWRGRGGYVIAPPSRHATGPVYRWVRPFGTVELDRVPAPLADLLGRDLTQRRPAERTGTVPPAGRQGYGHTALADECDRVRAAQPGQRNHTLNRAAFRCYQLAAAGLLDQDQVADEMAAAARQAGLGDAETRRTLASTRQAGLANPRRPGPRPGPALPRPSAPDPGAAPDALRRETPEETRDERRAAPTPADQPYRRTPRRPRL